MIEYGISCGHMDWSIGSDRMSEKYIPPTRRYLGSCYCKIGDQRDNCLDCEGSGIRIDFSVYHICPKCDKRGDSLHFRHRNGCDEE